MQDLKEVEDTDAKFLQQDRVGQPQPRESEKQQEGKPSGKSKSPRQSCKPGHRKLPATGRSVAAVISPGTPA
jgi:hypothetical protein